MIKFMFNCLWSVSVKLHTWSGALCEWCSDYYEENYWYGEVQKITGKLLWRVDK